MPLIPLFGPLIDEEKLPDWPLHSYVPETLLGPIADRIKVVADRLVSTKTKGGIKYVYRILSPLLGKPISRKLAQVVVEKVRIELEKRNLVSASK